MSKTVINHFPMERDVVGLLRVLDKIEYNDTNFSPSDRLTMLRHCWTKGAQYFAQRHIRETLNLEADIMNARLSTIVTFVVNSWSMVPLEVNVDLVIYWTFTILLDDCPGDYNSMMRTFSEDCLTGKTPQHPWLRLMHEQTHKTMKHYGSYCSLNLLRSTIDFYQGLWIESVKFGGYPGSRQYPLFLRRLNGLGHAAGATLFPATNYDEQELFGEITSAIAELEHYMVLVNDLISFYKEFEHEMILVKNYARAHSISVPDAFDKLVQEAIDSADLLMSVFKGKDSPVFKTIRAFMQGYVTWHLCDWRYRMKEVVDCLDDSEASNRFRAYYEHGQKTGQIPTTQWATPSIGDLVNNKE